MIPGAFWKIFCRLARRGCKVWVPLHVAWKTHCQGPDAFVLKDSSVPSLLGVAGRGARGWHIWWLGCCTGRLLCLDGQQQWDLEGMIERNGLRFFNSHLEQDFDYTLKGGWGHWASTTSIVEAAVWSCSSKVVGEGSNEAEGDLSGLVNPWDYGSGWWVPAGQAELSLDSGWSKSSGVEQDIWTALKQFWQTSRRLKRGKWCSTHTVYSAGAVCWLQLGDSQTVEWILQGPP